MKLPLAHHEIVAALPVFVPALIVSAVVLVQFIRDRRRQSRD